MTTIIHLHLHPLDQLDLAETGAIRTECANTPSCPMADTGFVGPYALRGAGSYGYKGVDHGFCSTTCEDEYIDRQVAREYP